MASSCTPNSQGKWGKVLLVQCGARLEEGENVGGQRLELESAERRHGLKLLRELLLVVERVVELGGIVRHEQGADELHSRRDERADHLRDVFFKARRRVALQVWHGRDEPGPEREKVVHRVGGPLPVEEGLDREFGDGVQPLGVAVRLHELGELVVRLEPSEQSAELVVVRTLRQASWRLQQREGAAHHAAKEGLALLVRGEQGAPERCELYECLEGERRDGRGRTQVQVASKNRTFV